MNKKLSAFVASFATAIMTVVFFVIIGSIPGKAYAYAVGPVPPPSADGSAAPIGQGYDFTNSFQNLVSSFTSFFDNIKATNGTVSVSGNTMGTPNGLPPGVTVTVDWQSYVNRFDTWFYGVTGVNIEWLTGLMIRFFGWFFGVLQGIVTWVAALATGAIRQTTRV